MSGRALVLTVGVFALAGCASTGPSLDVRAPAATGDDVRDVCDFGHQRVRLRDLTQAWDERTYLLADGSVCRPGAGP